MSRLHVGSEIGRLRRVILHRPQLSLSRLTPSNCDELLFDDVLRLGKAGEEHDTFRKTLEQHDVETFLLNDLLQETIADAQAKAWILDQQCSELRFGPTMAKEVRAFMENQDDHQFAKHLTGGVAIADIDPKLLKAAPKSLLGSELEKTSFVIDPLPNHLFTRDTSCWVYGGVSINPMMKPARQRETVHFKAVYRYHPMFKKEKFEVWYGGEERVYEGATIEGGDVEIIGNGKVLIGISERTTPQGIEMLAKSLFSRGGADEVIAIDLGKSRAAMHLDTVLTHMDRDCFTYYPGVVSDQNIHYSLTPGDNGDIVCTQQKGFFKTLARITGNDSVRMIPTGGDVFAAEREQWNDANNVLTIRPGVVVGYERNHYTIDNIEKAGIKFIAIPGDELGRGRGGARCMSCPIERDDI
ncbi:arginine deiminase [Oleiphilus sp. HI0009]|nr:MULTISPECIES: arginine deiminase [unclassified Oleiphilus]KZX76634.1 arginine deiminase [Oleiphilus sp. HI0009]KZY61580.1 arginine deiminase [Oleiphilus sp. HI0066]KZZ56343.1 arginine deiminase [Oleiphilus sp. HI0125]